MEFGSDFHYISDYWDNDTFCRFYSDARFYASGRHALEALFRQERWERLWLPDYFCYEVVAYFQSIGLNIVFYKDNPILFKENFSDLDFQKGDALLRINYFGLKAKRSNKNIPVPVIEDHTHDLIGQWAVKSDADWCFGSLRKTLPLAIGGVLWSPNHRNVPAQLPPSEDCLKISIERYEGMKMKSDFLCNGGEKDHFRKKYMMTETMIDTLPLSGIDYESYNVVSKFNVPLWTELKADNWQRVSECIGNRFRILPYEKKNSVHPFSIIILFDSNDEREKFRKYLIKNAIYPAVLWNIPNTASIDSVDFGKRMLSLHCDARYSRKSIEEMCEIINRYD